MQVTVKLVTKADTAFGSQFSVSYLANGTHAGDPCGFVETRSKLYERTDLTPSQVSQLLLRAFVSDAATARCGR